MSHTDLLLFFSGSTWVFLTFVIIYFVIIFLVLPFSFKQIGFRARLMWALTMAWFLNVRSYYYFYYLGHFLEVWGFFNIWFSKLFNFLIIIFKLNNFKRLIFKKIKFLSLRKRTK